MFLFLKNLLAHMEFNASEFDDCFDTDEPEHGLVERYKDLISCMYEYVIFLETVMEDSKK